MKNKIKGKINSKNVSANKLTEEEYSVHAFKFLIENDIF